MSRKRGNREYVKGKERSLRGLFRPPHAATDNILPRGDKGKKIECREKMCCSDIDVMARALI